jgi:hypothetical protein
MHSTKTLPYVYILTHKQTGQFYIGYRFANKVPSSEDMGKLYFTSSNLVKPCFNDFNISIIAEFFNKEDAYLFEQQLIKDSWSNPLILNRRFHEVTNEKMFIMNKPFSSETRSRMSESHKLRWTDDAKKVQSQKLTGQKREYKKRKPLSDDHRANIGKANIGKIRTKESRDLISQNHHDISGGKNPRAKKIVLTSPDGIKHIAVGNFAQKCKELKLSTSTMLRLLHTGKKAISGSTLGWNCYYD